MLEIISSVFAVRRIFKPSEHLIVNEQQKGIESTVLTQAVQSRS
jgi:hypothetical protein